MPFSSALVRLCFFLEKSPSYRRTKGFFHDLLDNPDSRMRPYFDVGMILLVLLSVFLLVYEVKHELGHWAARFEQLAVSVFLIEYLLRLWLCSDSRQVVIEHYERSLLVNDRFRVWPALREVLRRKWHYMTTPLAIVDLLAIIPSYRPLRVLRIFLLFRLFKLFRYARSINEFVKVLSEKRVELYTLFIFLSFLVFTSATAIYIFESRQEGGHIGNLFEAVYWSLVTMSTVGYGDITPQTPEGRFVTLMLIITGIGVLSFFTSIIVSAFNEKMGEIRDHRVFAELEKRGRHTIIAGYGRFGSEVAGHLARDGERLVVVESDPQKVEQAKRQGLLAVCGNAEDGQLLRSLGLHRDAVRVLCLTGDDVVNVYITLTARQLNPDIQIISRANRQETVKKLGYAGADYTVTPFKSAAMIASEYLGQPVAFEAIYGMLSGAEDIGIETVLVHERSPLIDTPLSDIDFRAGRLVLFGVITADERPAEQEWARYALEAQQFNFNPAPTFRLQKGDILVVFGHHFSIAHFKQRLEQ